MTKEQALKNDERLNDERRRDMSWLMAKLKLISYLDHCLYVDKLNKKRPADKQLKLI